MDMANNRRPVWTTAARLRATSAAGYGQPPSGYGPARVRRHQATGRRPPVRRIPRLGKVQGELGRLGRYLADRLIISAVCNCRYDRIRATWRAVQACSLS